jgi:hypothetical protein
MVIMICDKSAPQLVSRSAGDALDFECEKEPPEQRKQRLEVMGRFIHQDEPESFAHGDYAPIPPKLIAKSFAYMASDPQAAANAANDAYSKWCDANKDTFSLAQWNVSTTMVAHGSEGDVVCGYTLTIWYEVLPTE